MKELYSFVVNLEKEVEKTETKEEGGKTITVTQKVKEEVPVKIIIKQPSKRNLEDADLQYSIEMSSCIKKGILTKGMLVKKYLDSGGMVSETEAAEMIKIYNFIYQKEMEYHKLAGRTENKDEESQKKIVEEIFVARQRLIQLESNYTNLFNNTADTIAQNNVIRWFCLNMTHKQVLPDGNIEPMFPGDTFDAKVDSLHKMDEGEDQLYTKAYTKLATFVSFWFFSKNASKEDFEKLNKDIEEGKFSNE